MSIRPTLLSWFTEKSEEQQYRLIQDMFDPEDSVKISSSRNTSVLLFKLITNSSIEKVKERLAFHMDDDTDFRVHPSEKGRKYTVFLAEKNSSFHSRLASLSNERCLFYVASIFPENSELTILSKHHKTNSHSPFIFSIAGIGYDLIRNSITTALPKKSGFSIVSKEPGVFTIKFLRNGDMS